ncbi:MAG: hypothetical protein HW416_881 [Chloroflexi bacterium]|nr:hypothetical protein [Chloroflexota bacterium]
MCTYFTEKASMVGSSGKGAQGWFALQEANVAFDHPFHASLEHALMIDFINDAAGAGARVAVELTTDSARELIRAIEAALAKAEEEGLSDGVSSAA